MLSDADVERFWGKIVVQGKCWLWTGRPNGRGYPLFWVGKVNLYAHRVSYILARGPVPEGLELDHLCRNPVCVNPDHLEAVTHLENVRRGEVGRNSREKTHCPQGHPYEGENLAISCGRRVCKTCNRAKAKAYRERRARAQA